MTSDTEIIKILSDACSGLLYQTELDFPFEILIFDNTEKTAINKENILLLMKCSPEDYIEDFDFDFLFSTPTLEQDWHSPEDKKRVARYRNLVNTMRKNLTDIKVYRKGRIYIDVYITGKVPSGNIAIVSTKQMQT